MLETAKSKASGAGYRFPEAASAAEIRQDEDRLYMTSILIMSRDIGWSRAKTLTFILDHMHEEQVLSDEEIADFFDKVGVLPCLDD
jgi:hypothetical protein